MSALTRILVIKLGALGDVIQALGPMRAIRAHHPDAHITVLTGKAFAGLLEKTGLFNDIWIDRKPKWFDVPAWVSLIGTFNGGRFDRVYDLQNNDRTFFYWHLFQPKPEWVGAAPGASHRNADKNRSIGHAFDGHVQTLAIGGVQGVRVDDLFWMDADLSGLSLAKPYAVLVPGSAPQHTGKRWPHFAALSRGLVQRGVQPVLIGTKDEESVIQGVLTEVPEAVSLVGRTQLTDLPSLARTSVAVIGNDTGPMHLMGPTGAKTVVIMGPKSNPKRHYPLGEQVKIIHSDDLAAIAPDQVLTALDSLT